MANAAPCGAAGLVVLDPASGGQHVCCAHTEVRSKILGGAVSLAMREDATNMDPNGPRAERKRLLLTAGAVFLFGLYICSFFGCTGELTCTRTAPERVDCVNQPLTLRVPIWRASLLDDVRGARWELQNCDVEGCTAVFEAKTAKGPEDLKIGPFFTGSAEQAARINAFVQARETRLVLGTEGFVGTRTCFVLLATLLGSSTALALWLVWRARRGARRVPVSS